MGKPHKSPREKRRRSAVIQYMGIPGSSRDCQDAIVRLLQFGDRITHASVLTHDNEHAFLLRINNGDQVIVKSGFASGYGGTGPSVFSYVLQLLEAHGAEIDEFLVSEEFLERIEHSCLLATDVDSLAKRRPLSPTRWHDYVLEGDWARGDAKRLWEREFPAVIPYAIIDGRLMDLALTFWDAPSDRLLTAFRRLEDILRSRTGLKDRAGRLFNSVFFGDSPRLRWECNDDGESISRAELFKHVFTAFRNARAHGEPDDASHDQLAEFLLVNQLFRLERSAVDVPQAKRQRATKRNAKPQAQAG